MSALDDLKAAVTEVGDGVAAVAAGVTSVAAKMTDPNNDQTVEELAGELHTSALALQDSAKTLQGIGAPAATSIPVLSDPSNTPTS